MLFQLPPQFEPERDRLATFLRMLRPRYRHAFEFRHPVWYEVRIIGLLDEHGVSLCISSHLYVRGHGHQAVG